MTCEHSAWKCHEDTHICVDCDEILTIANKPEISCTECGYSYGFPDRFVTKDSGEREQFSSGMQRDIQGNKPRPDLLFPVDVPYEEQFLVRCAALLERGSRKYNSRNWELAAGKEELDRFKASAFRHFLQWLTEDTPEEDHAAAVVFGLLGAETVKYKMRHPEYWGLKTDD